MGILYRVRQFTLALGAQAADRRVEDLAQHLDTPQQTLFYQMSPVDRHHCLAVFHSVREAGHSDPSLLQAALIHDAGKLLGPVGIRHRVLAVLAKALFPSWWEKVQGQPGSGLYALYVYRNHAALGAELASRAGCSPEVVWLIAHHEDDREQGRAAGEMSRMSGMLAALQAADHAN